MHRSALEDQLELAIEAAHTAGRLLNEAFGHEQHIRHKGDINLVTAADEAAERAIAEVIRRRYPDDSILAEEGTSGGTSARRLWIVDPLDGTTNFAHGYPCFGVSIALEIDGVVELGVVYQPILDELFTGIRGHGANLNGKPIHVSAADQLISSMLCSGFPYDRSHMPRALDYWHRILPVAQAIRRDGAAAIDLCYVAMGRFDGFWERDLQSWDMAAGALIVTEAGGMLSDYEGKPCDVHRQEIVATNGRIHDALLEMLGDRARARSHGAL